jgi:hypothetical protein
MIIVYDVCDVSHNFRLKERDKPFICAAGPAARNIHRQLTKIGSMMISKMNWRISPATGYERPRDDNDNLLTVITWF